MLLQKIMDSDVAYVLITVTALSASIIYTAEIPTNVMFPLTAEVYEGKVSVVAITEAGAILSAFEFGGKLLTRTGHVSGIVSHWQEPQNVPGGEGAKMPAIAVNDNGDVVLLFQKGGKQLYAKTGKLKPTVVEWTNGEVSYDAGSDPSVALADDKTLVVSHETNGGLFYRVGKLDDSLKPDLGAKAIAFGEGRLSRLAINKHRQLVEASKKPGSAEIHSRIGTMATAGAVTWSPPEPLAKGDEHDISINESGFVVHVFSRSKSIYSVMGSLDKASGKIDWDPPQAFEEHSLNPTVAINKRKAIALVEAGGKAYSTVSLIIDRAKWMENTPEIMSKPLWQVTLPGTHDSGAFSLTNSRAHKSCVDAPALLLGYAVKQFATAQDRTFRQQLDGGIRYFDLRPYYWKRESDFGASIRDGKKKKRRRRGFFGDMKKKAQAITHKAVAATTNWVMVGDDDFHAYHDSIGPKISDILQDIANFLSANKKELIILSISHFCKRAFPDDIHKKFVELIKSIIGKFLFKHAWPFDMIKATIGDYIKDGPKVLIIYGNQFVVDTEGSANGFWPNLNTFDKYSNKDLYGPMKDDQLAKWKANQPSDSQLFLLSWTLTFTGKVKKTLHSITKSGNRFLPQFIDAHKKELKVNIIYVDYFQESGATDLAILLNKPPKKAHAGPAKAPANNDNSKEHGKHRGKN